MHGVDDLLPTVEPPNVRFTFAKMFMPITTRAMVDEISEDMDSLRMQKLFNNGTATFFDIAEPSS
jgi:hypothetical protein